MANDVTAYLKAQDSGFTSVLQKASSALNKFSGDSQKSGKTFLESAKSVMVGVGMYKAARAGLNAVLNSVSGAMQRQDTMDNFDRNLTRITGSTETATKTLDELKAATKGTAYGLGAVANSTMSYANSNIALEKSVQYSKDWMDAVAAYGDGTTASYEQVTLQLNQMASKGKANLGDLKSAMEAGIPVTQILAAQTGRSTEEISDALSKGEFSAEQFMDAMHEAFTSGAGNFKSIAGEAKNAGNTWKGTIDNMKSAITRGTLSMINSFDEVTKTLTGSSIKEWLSSVGALFENNLGKVGSALQSVVNFILPYKEAMQSAFVGVGGEVKAAILAVVQSLQGMFSAFDGTGSVNSFKEIMIVVAEKIKQTSIWIRQNSDEVAKWIVYIGKATLAFKGLQLAAGFIQPFVKMGADVSNVLSNFFVGVKSLNSQFSSKVITPMLSAISSGSGTVKTALGVFALNFQSSFEKIYAMDGYKLSTPFKVFSSALSETFPKIGQFNSKLGSMASAVTHPIQSMRLLKADLMALSVASGGSASVLQGASIKVSQGFKAMASGGISAIKSLTTAMLTNPITAILVGITAAVAVFALAWENNFMNIQGVMEKFGSGILKSITSLKSLFAGLGTAIKPLLTIFGSLGKVVGAIALGALMYTVAGLVDGFRLLVTVVMAVVRGFIIMGQSAKMVAKAFTGDWKGAGQEFDKIKGQISEINKGFVDLGKNSAIKATTESFSEFGKKVDDSKNKVNEMRGKVSTDLNSIGTAAQEMTTKFEESKAKMDEVFNYDGQNEANLKYFETAKASMDNFSKAQEETNAKYQAAMDEISQIDEKNVDRRAKMIADANTVRMSSTIENNKGLIALEQDYNRMLSENQDASGEALTEQQRGYMEQQTAMIKEQLMLQNEAYVQSAQEKINQGVQLSEQELNTTMATMGVMYQQKQESIQTNEAKMAELKEVAQNAQSEAERVNAEQEITALVAKNQQLSTSQGAFGDQMMQMLSSQGVVNVQTVLSSMQQMGAVTDGQLVQILSSFQQNGANIDQQLQLLGGVMQQRGIEGADQLALGLQSKDLSAIAGNMTEGMKQGIASLPPAMFNNGDQGKQKFIDALNNGNYKEAGNQLSSKTSSGIEQGKAKIDEASKKVADVLPKETKKKEADAKNAGKDVGNAVGSGVDLSKQDVVNKSKGVMTSSSTAMKSVDFKPVGAHITNGVAEGMNGLAAMAKAQSIVDQVKAKMQEAAQIHSPSRLFRDEVGKYISQGLAVGIEEYGQEAIDVAGNLMDSIYEKSNQADFASIIPNSGKLEITTNDGLINRLESTFKDFINSHQYMVLDTGEFVGNTIGSIDSGLGGVISVRGRNTW